MYLLWIVSDNRSSSPQSLPQIRLYDCSFPSNVYSIDFTLSGLMSLIRCEFRLGLDVIGLVLEKSRYELEITEETLRDFKSKDDQNRIEIIQTKIDVYSLYIDINNAATCLKMENVDLDLHDLQIHIGKEGHDFQTANFLELEMIDCRIMSGKIMVYLGLPNSFGTFRFDNVVFERISLLSKQQAGLGNYVFDNCTFIKALHVDIQRFLDFKIVRSAINLPHDCDGTDCDVQLTGMNRLNVMSDIKLLLNIFFNRISAVSFYSIFCIESSSFQGGQGPFITVHQADLKISKTIFHIQSPRARPENLIDFQGDRPNHLDLKDVLIDFTSLDRDVQQINIMSIVTVSVDIKNIQILCPIGMDAVETLNRNEPLVYHCEAACTSDMYTFQYGNMTLHGFSTYWSPTSLVYALVNPHCNQCPVGAKCSGDIKTLPNYWGYRNKNDVVMIRCPTGYCCQNDESCQCFESCNSNRSGPLCGICEKGFAESLFDQTCIPVEKCHTWFIVLLYISCAVGYGLGLMVIDNIKKALVSSLKKIYQCVKGKLVKNVKPNQNLEKAKNSEKSDSTKKEVKEEGNFKYLQILFYYVQDAALFKIELPGKQSEQTSTFVKILQFTPDVLTSIYDSVTETCFTFGTTAVSKILFKSIFGPCVMFFLFAIYLCQLCVFSITRKMSKFNRLIKYKLVQSFVLVILLSYQQIVTGALTLVKCIDIENINRLYVQGNIQCFTHWQTAIEIFIWANIFPSFFVFSHVPYYVEMKQMSVQMFILVCILPVPGLMIFHLTKAWNKFRMRYNVQTHSDIELNTVLNSNKPLELEEREVHQEEISAMMSGVGSNLSLSSIVCTDTLELSHIISDSDTDIANWYSTDLMAYCKTDSKKGTLAEQEEMTTDTDRSSKHSSELDSKDQNDVDSKEAITETLLKHYKTMKLFGISFNWLAIHKVYRMILVACNTYISHPIIKLCIMSSFLLGIMVLHSLLKPYKKRPANVAATVSYVANCGISMINLIKAWASEYGCKIKCSDKSEVLEYLHIGEQILLVYVPIASVCLWMLSTMLQKCVKQSKKE